MRHLFLILVCALGLAACGAQRSARVASTGPAPQLALQVAKTAKGQVGVPYVSSGISPKMGFDCSGLVYYAYQKHGFTVPREARKQAEYGQRVPSENVREGDIVVFKTGFFQKHTGIYVGNGEFVHAPGKGRKVEKKRMDAPHWQRMLVGVRRIVQ